MRRTLLVAVGLFAVGGGWGQRLPLRLSAQEQGQRLARALAGSDFVIYGRMREGTGVAQRLTPEERMRIWEAEGLGGFHGASLFRLDVTETLCRRGDSVGVEVQDRPAARPARSADPKELAMVIPDSAPMYEDDLEIERYIVGRSYLLFAEKFPDGDKLTRTYKLNPDADYYRAFRREEGVIELPKGEQQLARVRKLCEAARQPRLEMKLGMLNQLRGTGDDVLDSAADELIRILQPPKKDASER